MKNYCGILEHDYGCNCVNTEIKGMANDIVSVASQDTEAIKNFIESVNKVEASSLEASKNIQILSKQLEYQIAPTKPKHPTNLTPKKKKRKR